LISSSQRNTGRNSYHPRRFPVRNDTKDEDTLDDNISTGNEIEKRHRQTE
jgi:hypothetical protein